MQIASVKLEEFRQGGSRRLCAQAMTSAPGRRCDGAIVRCFYRWPGARLLHHVLNDKPVTVAVAEIALAAGGPSFGLGGRA